MLDDNYYPVCENCEVGMEPVYFTEYEYKVENGNMYETGRKRLAVDYFVCPVCLRKSTVDDTFDGPWYR